MFQRKPRINSFMMLNLPGGGSPSGGSPPASGDTLYPGIPSPTYTNSALEALGYTAWPYDPMTIANPSLPSPWTSDQTGFYYVQAGGGSGGNGNPTSPRSTLPSTLAAGDVCVISGDVSDDGTLTASGTSGSPCFILSANSGRLTGVTYTWAGTHLIIDTVGGYYTSGTGTVNSITGSYVTVRNGTWRGNRVASRQGFAFSGDGDHVMFYNNLVYDFGYWASPTDDNRHGIKVSAYNQFWIIDNIFHDITNDGVQVGDTNTPSVSLGFLAGNECYGNAQTGLWLKNCYDVILSSNTCYDHVDAAAGGGGYYMLGGQYDFANAWWLNNELYGLGGGCYIGSGNGTQTDGAKYFIGNLIHDTTNPTFDETNPHSPHGFTDRNSTNSTKCVNNTFENCHAGYSSPYGTRTVLGNTFSTITASSASQIYLDGTSGNTVNYNAYEGSCQVRYGSTSLGSFATLTGAGHEANGEQSATLTYVNSAGGDYTPASGSSAQATNALHSVYATFEARYGMSIAIDRNDVVRPQGTWDRGAYES